MAMKRSGRGTGAKQSAAAATAKTGPHKVCFSYILEAPKGKRTVSHRRIEQAVDKVFRARAHADA